MTSPARLSEMHSISVSICASGIPLIYLLGIYEMVRGLYRRRGRLPGIVNDTCSSLGDYKTSATTGLKDLATPSLKRLLAANRDRSLNLGPPQGFRRRCRRI